MNYKQFANVVFFMLVVNHYAMVDGGAYLQINFVSFSDSSGTHWNGGCCFLFCWSGCDPIFHFHLDLTSGSDSYYPDQTCYYWDKVSNYYDNENVVSFNADINGINNPIVTYIPNWQGSVKFKAYVEDHNTIGGPDPIDGFIQLLQISPSTSQATANWQSVQLRGLRPQQKTSLAFNVRLFCEPDYYNSNCAVHCIAQNDNVNGHYTCDPVTGNPVCRPGYTDPATYCIFLINNCQGNNCQNGATCVSGVGTYTCSCAPNFSGQQCQINLNECQSQPCQNGGTCTNLAGSFQCQCNAAYVGPNCASRVCDVHNYCLNGGTCYGAGLCNCTAGFVGSDCSVDRCSLMNCQNGGRCYAGQCQCVLGYIGSQCDIAACSLLFCQNGGTCMAGKCFCQTGYTGAHCETEINECLSQPCQNGGTCLNLPGAFQCSCTSLYAGPTCSSLACTSVNPCLNGGTCYGARQCYCTPGYVGNDCSTNRCSILNCQNNATCQAGTCVCRPGYTGVACDVNICTLLLCQNGGTCSSGSSGSSGVCSCLPQFTGRFCDVPINNCLPNSCSNGGTCVNKVGEFQCLCPPQYAGPTCSNSICDIAKPCQNGGSCYGAGLCRCLTGFLAADCSISMCDLVNCRNGGTCLHGQCHCAQGFTGSACEIDQCSLMCCQNGGTCIAGKCSCAHGFTGTSCEMNMNECVSDPCQHDSTCEDTINGYICRCKPGYNGTFCSTALEPPSLTDVSGPILIQSQSSQDISLGRSMAEQLWIALLCLLAILFIIVIALIIAFCVWCRRWRKKRNSLETKIEFLETKVTTERTESNAYTGIALPSVSEKVDAEEVFSYCGMGLDMGETAEVENHYETVCQPSVAGSLATLPQPLPPRNPESAETHIVRGMTLNKFDSRL